MTNWTDSYVTGIAYTHHYFSLINPVRLKLLLLSQGWQFPEINTACELGFGHGLTINTHAAASTTTWHGTDFLPAHARLAEEMADASGADVKVDDQSFETYCARQDLPTFDYICLHGIWSWVSSENRATIVDFIRRNLKPGGLVYISYNTLPGWSNLIPLRETMMAYIENVTDPNKDIQIQANEAFNFIDKLLNQSPAFDRENPQAKHQFKEMRKKEINYLIHELLNINWAPMSFSSLNQALKPAELTYIGSADYLNNIDIVNLNKEQLSLANEFTDPAMRETTRDFLLNAKFRTDIWVKSPTPLSSVEQNKLIREQRFMIAKNVDTAPKTISTPLGQIKLNKAIYNPVLEALAGFQIKTIKQIEMHCRKAQISLDQITQAILVLCSKGFIVAVQDDQTINKANAQTDRLNTYLLERVARQQEGKILTSPVTGGAINFSYLGLLFILALKKGKKTPKASAEFVWNRIKKQRGSIYIGDKLVRDAGSAKAELAISAQNFYEKENDLLKAMKII